MILPCEVSVRIVVSKYGSNNYVINMTAYIKTDDISKTAKTIAAVIEKTIAAVIEKTIQEQQK